VDHQAYFDNQVKESLPRFWSRFGRRPECEGKRVLDLGCAHGAMTYDLASQGADVVGIDLNPEFIAWAKENVGGRPVRGSMEFVCADIREADIGDFDIIASKDTFEHIQDLGSMLVTLRDRLRPGGQIWVGFSPFFYSPKGDHGEAAFRLPWAHVVSRRLFYAAASRRRGAPVHSLADVGLNGLTPADFRRHVAEAGLRFESVQYNVHDRPLMAVMNAARRIPALERYATVSVYAVLAPSHG
jgi:SAM-dependent methyltransferase